MEEERLAGQTPVFATTCRARAQTRCKRNRKDNNAFPGRDLLAHASANLGATGFKQHVWLRARA
eukprot:2200761-Lingulodinium_polyedra.AAC.1